MQSNMQENKMTSANAQNLRSDTEAITSFPKLSQIEKTINEKGGLKRMLVHYIKYESIKHNYMASKSIFSNIIFDPFTHYCSSPYFNYHSAQTPNIFVTTIFATTNHISFQKHPNLPSLHSVTLITIHTNP